VLLQNLPNSGGGTSGCPTLVNTVVADNFPGAPVTSALAMPKAIAAAK